MDSALLLALPLVGGLIFCNAWNATRFRAAREEGYRLYFRVIFYGTFLFIVSLLTRAMLFAYFSSYESFEGAILRLITPIAKDAATATQTAQLVVIGTYSMLIALPMAKLLNLVLGKKRWLLKAMDGDELEQMLYEALDRKVPICLTMDDRKVYVGFVVGTPDPTKPRKTVSTLPLMSGYRDRATRRVNFTTYYKDIYGADAADEGTALPPPLDHLTLADFVTILPIEKLSSCRLFDLRAYEEFNARRGTGQPIADASDDKSG